MNDRFGQCTAIGLYFSARQKHTQSGHSRLKFGAQFKSMVFQALSADHFNQLFQFEVENRIWFETLISSRGEEFYTTKGIRSHIREAVEGTKLGRSYSGVLIENGHISARGNLKNICNANASCEVGYRVASSP